MNQEPNKGGTLGARPSVARVATDGDMDSFTDEPTTRGGWSRNPAHHRHHRGRRAQVDNARRATVDSSEPRERPVRDTQDRTIYADIGVGGPLVQVTRDELMTTLAALPDDTAFFVRDEGNLAFWAVNQGYHPLHLTDDPRVTSATRHTAAFELDLEDQHFEHILVADGDDDGFGTEPPEGVATWEWALLPPVRTQCTERLSTRIFRCTPADPAYVVHGAAYGPAE